MAHHTALHTRARYIVETLTPLLPLIQFHAYVSREAKSEQTDLYLLGYILSDILLGGYTIPPPLVRVDCELNLLRVVQFFDQAWKEGKRSFFPPTLRSLYEVHIVGEAKWYRVA